MSYETATRDGHALQYCQDGDIEYYRAWLNQFFSPQYDFSSSSRPASYHAVTHPHIFAEGGMTNATNAYPTGPHVPQYVRDLRFDRFAQAPSTQGGASTSARSSLENNLHTRAQGNEPTQSDIHPHDSFPEYPRERDITARGRHQNRRARLFRTHSSPTNLTAIHPTLGPCILVPIRGASDGDPAITGSWMVHHRDHYNRRLDRLRRRHDREDSPYLRSATPSPTRSASPYVSTPSSSPRVTYIPSGRGDGSYVRLEGFTPYDRPHSSYEPGFGRDASFSTARTCSECRESGFGSSCGPTIGRPFGPTSRTAQEHTTHGHRVPERGDNGTGNQDVQASVEVDT